MKIKHVHGNVLKLDIPLTIKIRTMEGDVPTEREEPFYPDVSKGCAVILGNSYNRKIQYDATVSGNVAHIEDDGVIGIGTYKVTVKCYDEEGNPYRYMVRDIIEICDATIDAGIEAGVEFNAETYTLEGAVFISYGVEQVQSDWDEQDDESKAYIKNKPDHIVTDEHYVHTDNNYTSVEKEKLAELENYDDSGIRQELDGKVDKVAGKGLSTNDFTNEDKSKLNSALQSETDPTVPSWAKQPNKPNYTAQEVGALPNSTKYGSTIDLTMNSTTYVLTLSLKDQDGTVLNTKTVDLPIESVVVNGRYDATNKKIVLTLQSGGTIDVPVGDLIVGLQTEITSVNMLDADLVDDTNSTHKFVTAQEKQAWNNKSDFSGSYNDLSDKPTIPTTLSQLSEDTTHRTVSDTEKQTWNNKQDALDFETTPSSSNKVATMADIPSSLPANGGNAATVNGHSVNSDVPDDAVFTDTTYSTMGASGSTHAGGLVPDTPSSAGTTKFLREDGTWAEPATEGGTSYVPTLNAAPTSSTVTYPKDGQILPFEIGQFCRVPKTGGGYDFYQLYDLQTENNVTATWVQVGELPSNVAYISSDSGVGIVPEDGIRAETVTSAAAMTVNPDVVTVINGAVGTAAITLQVPNDNLAHVWDILLTTDSTVAITFAMSNSATILYPSGFSVGTGKNVEISVIGVGTKYYLRYGEFA